jgi:alkylhydroperoxidase family enzyme
MPRPLKPPPRENVPEGDRADYDLVVSRQRRLWEDAPRNSDAYFGALLNSPTIAAALATLGRVMREGQVRGTYSDADRELVDMVLSVDFEYRAILALHIPDAIAVGVRLEAIEALWHRREGDLTDDERFLVAYIRGVATGAVEDRQFDALTERMGERGAVEYSAFIAFLIMTFRLWQALGVPDPSAAEIDGMLDSYRSGAAPAINPQARIG